MRLPNENTDPEKLYLDGRYVVRALTRAAFADLRAKVDTANDALLASDRRLFDLRAGVEESISDRDYVDSLLDDSARGVRNSLAARYVGADRERPFTAIFANGLEEYVDAKLADQVDRYGRLCARISAHLPPDDLLVTRTLPEIQAQLAAWERAVKGISAAKNTLDTGKARLARAVEEWRHVMLEVYGILLGRVGKKKAERFFPSRATARKPKTEEVIEEEEPVDEEPLGPQPSATQQAPEA